MISSTPLWKHYEERLLEVFLAALDLLRSGMPADTTLEDDINWHLCKYLRRANFELHKKGRGVESTPVFNAPAQAHTKDKKKPPQASKRPDFQHELMDDQAPTVDSAYRCYHIECKRLGTPRLARDYVREGVQRFRDNSHRYGHRCPSGAMIGYVQDLELGDILSRVNAENERQTLALIILALAGWKPSGISRLDQSFARPFPISRFELRHLWVDIRSV